MAGHQEFLTQHDFPHSHAQPQIAAAAQAGRADRRRAIIEFSEQMVHVIGRPELCGRLSLEISPSAIIGRIAQKLNRHGPRQYGLPDLITTPPEAPRFDVSPLDCNGTPTALMERRSREPLACARDRRIYVTLDSAPPGGVRGRAEPIGIARGRAGGRRASSLSEGVEANDNEGEHDDRECGMGRHGFETRGERSTFRV